MKWSSCRNSHLSSLDNTDVVERGDRSNDLFIGSCLPLHTYDERTNTKCGMLNQHSVYLKEAMRFAIFKLNSNRSILNGIKLYAFIRDTCGKYLHSILGYFSFSRIMGIWDSQESEKVVFSATSMAIFNMIIVSHTAASAELNDRLMFGNFFRTIPSDDAEMLAIADLIRYFNWTYISVVSSHGYKQQSADSLIAAIANQACVAAHIALPKSAAFSDYTGAILKLLAKSRANVIVVIATTIDTRLLLHALDVNPEARQRFTLVFGSRLMAYKGFVERAKRAATGSISLSFSDMRVREFDEHVDSQVTEYRRYDWLRTLIPKILNCTLYSNSRDGLKKCNGTEKLDVKLSHMFRNLPTKAVISTVHTIACGVRKFIERHCFTGHLSTKQCKDRLMEFYTSKDPRIEILRYYQNGSTSCPDLPHAVSFDATGSYHRDFDIINFDGEDFQTVGSWKLITSEQKGLLKLDTRSISWKTNGTVPKSRCSTPCKINEIKIEDLLYPRCCFSCKRCCKNCVIINNTCIECAIHQRPDFVEFSRCDNLPSLTKDFTQALPALIIFISLLGLTCTTAVVVVFAVYRKNPVIKASSREISIVILLSLYATSIASLLFIITATISICAVRRIIIGVSFTSCYGALMLKMNRVYRIFKAASASASPPSLASTRSQVIICLAFLLLQTLLGLAWLYADPVSVSTSLTKNGGYIVQRCDENSYNFLLNLLPCSVFMLQCTYYAFKTRKFPQNFNEASSIGHTMYLNCVLWVAFIPAKLLLQSNTEYLSDMATGIFSSLIGLVSALGLFGPKVYRVLFRTQNSVTFNYFFSSHSSTRRTTGAQT